MNAKITNLEQENVLLREGLEQQRLETVQLRERSERQRLENVQLREGAERQRLEMQHLRNRMDFLEYPRYFGRCQQCQNVPDCLSLTSLCRNCK